MSATADLMVGLAGRIAAAGIATYRADGSPYTPSETGIYFNDMPPDPDRVVVLTAYSASSDQPEITLGERRIQVRTRGFSNDVFDADVLSDAIFDVLHGLANQTYGSVHVVQVLRISAMTLGMDDPQRRWMRSDNYSVDLDYATTALRPV